MAVEVVAGVALAGALGALARDAVDRALTARLPHARLPVGILLVNVLGSLALGLLIGAGGRVDPAWVAVLGSGFAGAFTTFSTFAVQVWRLPPLDALAYVAVSAGCCVAVAAVGMALL